MLSQPTSDIILPEELQKSIEGAQANLYNLETKASVQIKANASMQKENDTLLKQHEYLIAQIAILTAQETALKAAVDALNASKSILDSSLVSLNTELDNKASKQVSLEMDYKNRIAELEKATLFFSQSKEKFGKEQNILIHEKEMFKDKVSKLKEVISTI